MLRILSWDINQQRAPWQVLVDSDADVALLQEAKPPPQELATRLEVTHSDPWETASALDLSYRTAIVRLSDRVTLRPRTLSTIAAAQADGLPASRAGTLAVADMVVESTEETITVASMYGVWD